MTQMRAWGRCPAWTAGPGTAICADFETAEESRYHALTLVCERFGLRPLIRARPLNVIDHHHLHGSLARFQLNPQLRPQRLLEGRA